MNDDAGQQLPIAVGSSYAHGQLTAAFVTALTHADPATRERAEQRVRDWRKVLDGLADGTLRVGSRTPAGLPAWVTLDVVRGGFATGSASAGGELQPYEQRAAKAVGIPADRAALFAHSLTESGLATLGELLDSGHYLVSVPEEAALLTVAWLVRAGDVRGAAELVGALEPFADRLRFTPRPARRPARDPGVLHRYTVGDASRTLFARMPNTAVETQREALTVWQPFGDELLAHWSSTELDGSLPDPAWLARGRDLLTRYQRLAAEHTRCTAHRKPKENLAILRTCLEEVVAGRPLPPRRLGLLRHAVESMVRRRGTPGSAEHTALRRAQADQAAQPSYHALAQLLLRRLSELDPESGAGDTAALLVPVTAGEYRDTGIPEGTAVPATLRRTVESALSAPLDTLMDRGVIPSAEVLAQLVPQVVGATTAEAYPDPAARTLVGQTYLAFRNRRSLLLLDLEHQVGIEELPWMRAMSRHRADHAGLAPAHSALRELGELVIQGFPGTILPNPLVRELDVLARRSGLRAPLVEELAADIFMGTFTPKFLEAARVAGELLTGSLYERYYGIDYAALREQPARRRRKPLDVPGFARLCAERACRTGVSVAANGTVIEQAQILTTHNLAVLVHVIGVTPTPGWPDLTHRAFHTVCTLTTRLHNNPRPLATIKDIAYAWRQMLFYLSLCTPETRTALIPTLTDHLSTHPAHAIRRLTPALHGLHWIAAGNTFTPEGTADNTRARRLLGWTTTPHWLRP